MTCPRCRRDDCQRGTVRACQHCGHNYVVQRSNGKYCSQLCRHRANREAAYRASHQPRPCAECGGSFTPVLTYQVYCSKRCRYRHRTTLARAVYQAGARLLRAIA